MRRLLVILVVVLATTAGALATPLIVREARLLPTYDDERILTILAIGSDIGPPARPGNPLRGRADAIHLIAVDTRKATATIVDFPRDSVIAGDKVNAHMARGGPESLRRRLEEYTNLDIDHYVVTSFAGMRRMVEALGGVEITLKRPIRDRNAHANLRAGKQRLSGREALAFTRTRKTLSGGDFDRTHNQGRVLIAAQRQVRLQRPRLSELTRLAAAFARNTESDISVRTLYKLMTLAQRVDSREIKHISLRGSIGSLGGASVVHLHGTDAFRDIRRGRIGR